MNYIVKRDGRKVQFNRKKIEKAVEAAFIEVDGELTEYDEEKAVKIADYIQNKVIDDNLELSVEQIQDLVENGLMSTRRKDVARAYIKYRYERTKAREKKSKLMIAVGDRLMAVNVQNQNANVDEYSFGGRRGEATNEVMKQYALDHVMSFLSRYNHINNIIYIHDLDSYALGMHNCFHRDTLFVTNYGVKSFANFNDGDKIQVLDMNGKWRDATVRYYGKKQMQKVTFERFGFYKEVICTKDHRWILKDNTVTTDLDIGDKLYPLCNNTEYNVESQRDAEMFCLGFILGDGVDHWRNNNQNLYTEVRLCGNKTRYKDIFDMALYTQTKRSNIGSDLYYIKPTSIGKQSFLTNKMWKLLTLRDKISLFNGYFAADGSATSSTISASTSDERVLEMITDISSLAGYHVFNITEKRNSTQYKQDRLLYTISFSRSQSTNSCWSVLDIEPLYYEYEAWCIEEPITHSFTLEGGMVTGNCLSIPFDDLLANGFNTRQTDVRPANSANTALQLIAVIFQLQSLQQFGGVSATHLDWTLVPYVRKSFFKHYVVAYLKSLPEFQELDLLNLLFEDYDDEAGITRNKFDDWIDNNKQEFLDKFNLKFEDFTFDNKEKLDLRFYQSALYDTIVEVKQAIEAMYHNLNTLQSRAGNQLPFTSINYGTCTSEEGRLVIKALIDGSIKGVGKFHKTSIFPCGIFQVGKGINKHKGDPNYDLFRRALKSTAKRLYPNYANIDWSGNAGYDPKDPSTYFSTMGCRTANGWDINGFGQMKDGRGNICPVTIIMPTIAMYTKLSYIEKYGVEVAKEDKSHIVDAFIGELYKKIDEAKDMLIERFNYICSQDPSSAKFMYENGLMKGYVPEEGIRSALKHGTLAIGQLGLAETLQILIGCDHCDPEGMRLAKRIEALFRDRCKEFKEEYKLNFGVYYTPAENLCYTAMKKFKDMYGEIPNVSDKSYFTNSIHVPVWKEINPFEKIDIESQLTGYSSAGCITYVEFDSAILQNLDAIETIVLYAMDHDIPYFAVNIPNDLCLECGYTGEFNDHCPVCNSTNINQLRRVTGYLTGNYTTAFNPGKQEEVKMRFQHTKKLSDQLQR